MSKEEAIVILKEDGCGYCTWQSINPYECENKECKLTEALDMAIKALENHDTFMKYAYSLGKHDALSQEPCDDTISRSDMLDAIGHGTTYTSEELQRIITNLPSVTQKSGKWIERQNIARTSIATAIEFRWTYECSKCGHEVRHKTRFCASCGAKMVEPQESEE